MSKKMLIVIVIISVIISKLVLGFVECRKLEREIDQKLSSIHVTELGVEPEEIKKCMNISIRDVTYDGVMILK